MVPALALTLFLAQSPAAGAAGVAAEEADPLLKGFDVSLTLYNSSGVYFGEGGYSNSFTLWVEPSYALGRRFFKGTWLQWLSFNVRLPIEAQVTGNDARFGGTAYGPRSAPGPGTLYTPESAAIEYSQAEAPRSSPVLLGDMFVQLAHSHLLTIPLLGIDVLGSLRSGLPTSIASRNAGFITSLGLGLIFERRFLDRFSIGYMVRPTKFFYSRTHGGIAKLDAPVIINGNPEATYTPSSTGVANPDYMILNGVWASVDLPAGFAVSLNYFTFNTKPFPNSGGCNPVGVAGADVCADGAAQGNLQNQWRNDHWFLASVDYHRSFWSMSLGLSTYRPIIGDSRSVTQPFFVSNRENLTTVYLSFSASAEGIAGFVAAPGESKK